MTSDQYQFLLNELARVGGLTDTAVLLSSGFLRVGDRQFQLERGPGSDISVMKIHVVLGVMEPTSNALMRGMLQANHGAGRGGDYLFSQNPLTGDACFTVRLALAPVPSGQELWVTLSEIFVYAAFMWEQFTEAASAGPSPEPATTHIGGARTCSREPVATISPSPYSA